MDTKEKKIRHLRNMLKTKQSKKTELQMALQDTYIEIRLLEDALREIEK